MWTLGKTGTKVPQNCQQMLLQSPRLLAERWLTLLGPVVAILLTAPKLMMFHQRIPPPSKGSKRMEKGPRKEGPHPKNAVSNRGDSRGTF